MSNEQGNGDALSLAPATKDTVDHDDDDDELTIIVIGPQPSSTDGDDEGAETQTTSDDNLPTFKYKASILRYYFTFFDSLMKSGMKEAQTKRVTLKDVDPTTFRLAVEYLLDPCTYSEWTPTNMMQVAPLYHQYGSMVGLELVQTVLIHHMESWDFCSGRQEMQAVVVAISKIQDFGLDELDAKAPEFLRQTILYAGKARMKVYTEDQLRLLQPYLMEHRDVLNDFSVKYCRGTFLRSVDCSQPSFPEWFCTKLQMMATFDIIRAWKPKMTLHLQGQDIAGEESLSIPLEVTNYTYLEGRDPLHTKVIVGPFGALNLSNETVDKQYNLLDWVIVLKTKSGTMEFIFPGSGCHSLPPPGQGWQPSNSYTARNLTYASVSVVVDRK